MFVYLLVITNLIEILSDMGDVTVVELWIRVLLFVYIAFLKVAGQFKTTKLLRRPR